MSTQLNKTVKNIANHTQSFANIIQKELADTGFEKNLPIDLVLDMVNTIIKQEIGKMSVMKTMSRAETSVAFPASNKGNQLTLQLKPFLSRAY
jgi:hypothetical protein